MVESGAAICQSALTGLQPGPTGRRPVSCPGDRGGGPDHNGRAGSSSSAAKLDRWMAPRLRSRPRCGCFSGCRLETGRGTAGLLPAGAGSPVPVVSFSGTGGGTRTRTACGLEILSLLCLPFHHARTYSLISQANSGTQSVLGNFWGRRGGNTLRGRIPAHPAACLCRHPAARAGRPARSAPVQAARGSVQGPSAALRAPRQSGTGPSMSGPGR